MLAKHQIMYANTWRICPKCAIGLGATKYREKAGKEMKILVLNAGSSSQKIRLYELAGDVDPRHHAVSATLGSGCHWGDKKDSVTIRYLSR